MHYYIVHAIACISVGRHAHFNSCVSQYSISARLLMIQVGWYKIVLRVAYSSMRAKRLVCTPSSYKYPWHCLPINVLTRWYSEYDTRTPKVLRVNSDRDRNSHLWRVVMFILLTLTTAMTYLWRVVMIILLTLTSAKLWSHLGLTWHWWIWRYLVAVGVSFNR
jgi:hypothetical protein